MNSNQKTILLILSFILASLITLTSLTGLLSNSFYFKETLNWQAQSIGQDLIDLFIVIFLLISALLIYYNKQIAVFLWAGTIVYLLYTFLIYCFDIHFNILFIEYCIILGLSFYSLCYFFYSSIDEPPLQVSSHKITKLTAIYFIIISVLFYSLWLLEIIPSILKNSIPKNLTEGGLFTNPVHVIDLSIFLPGVFITAILLLRKKKIAYILAPIILTFFILMDITIGTLTLVMNYKGIETNRSIVIIMAFLALFSMLILFLNIKNIRFTQK